MAGTGGTVSSAGKGGTAPGGAGPAAGSPNSAGNAGSGGTAPSSGGSGASVSAGTANGGQPGVAGASFAGASSGGGAGSANGGATTGAGGSAGAPSGGCPAGASFCADFEGAGLPQGASFMPAYQASMWSDMLSIDAATSHGGAHSLLVKPTGSDGYSYRVLAVAAPAPSFWVRLWVKSDVDLGQADHNAFFGASTADGDQNNGELMEVAEQYCQVVMNHKDDVVTSIGGTTACGMGGVSLAKNAWHCVEAFFDGPNGHLQINADGQPVIDKSGWAKLTYQSFVFGFVEFHGPSRSMWYDDVAVSTTHLACP